MWSSDPWGSGVSQLARMVYDEQPLALIGSIDSATTHLAEQIVAKANLPLVSPIATDKSITLAGVSWMFSCAPSDAAIARVLVDAIVRAANDRQGRLVLITTTDHESRLTAREVVRELSRRHQPPDFRFDLRPRTADLTGALAALTEIEPSLVLILADTEDSARITRAIREHISQLASHPSSHPTRLDPAAGEGRCLIFGGQSMARTRFLELAGPAGEGVCFPLPAALDPSHPDAERFVTQFAAARHHAPDYTALLTYDATRLLLEAIRQAGPNRSRIRNALASLSPWEGITGTIQFDGTGQNVRTNIAMATLQNGAVVPLPESKLSKRSASRPAPSPARNVWRVRRAAAFSATQPQLTRSASPAV